MTLLRYKFLLEIKGYGLLIAAAALDHRLSAPAASPCLSAAHDRAKRGRCPQGQKLVGPSQGRGRRRRVHGLRMSALQSNLPKDQNRASRTPERVISLRRFSPFDSSLRIYRRRRRADCREKLVRVLVPSTICLPGRLSSMRPA